MLLLQLFFTSKAVNLYMEILKSEGIFEATNKTQI
jgi:hypothetical protein